jgi:triosephosphate isomerase (TIM)
MATTRTPLMAGNWKMYKDHREAVSLVQTLAVSLKDAKHDTAQVEVAVMPPFTALRSVQSVVEGEGMPIAYGAQDCSTEDEGARTGEVSARMLSRLGCRYVVLGHSERRQFHAEDDALVAAKAAAALRNGLTPIVCVGEGLDVRREGRQVEVTLGQLDGSLAGLDADQVAGLVVAYEPVWAIGTGEVATPADAQEVCAAIRARVAEVHGEEAGAAVRVLYGGSVKPGNIAAIMAEEDVDGALVGGASLDPGDFVAICRYREHQVGL